MATKSQARLRLRKPQPPPPPIKAWDCFNVAGRGTLVSVDVPATNHVRFGYTVRFELPAGRKSSLIEPGKDYVVVGIEESRCLVDHGPGEPQCVRGRCLMVREK